MDLHAIYLEFVESAVHTLLYARGIYPKHIFEQRSKYGLSLWQCRHAEIDAYVRKVLSNSYQLLLAGVIGSYVVTVYDKDNSICEQIAINGEVRGLAMAAGQRVSTEEQQALILSSLEVLETEFQSAILKLKMINDHVPRALPPEHRWALLVTTTAPITHEEVSSELRSGNWYADSGQLIENQPGRARKVAPLKSIRNELISLNINATYVST